MYFSYVVVNCNGRTRNPFRRSESKQRPFCLQAQVWLLPLYFNILTDTGFLLMIPTCCQSWRLNRTNTTCCMFAWRNVSAAVTLKTCRSAWQLPINVTNNIPRYLRKGTYFAQGHCFFGTMPPQFDGWKIYASRQTVEIHCLCLSLYAARQTWHPR